MSMPNGLDISLRTRTLKFFIASGESISHHAYLVSKTTHKLIELTGPKSRLTDLICYLGSLYGSVELGELYREYYVKLRFSLGVLLHLPNATSTTKKSRHCERFHTDFLGCVHHFQGSLYKLTGLYCGLFTRYLQCCSAIAIWWWPDLRTKRRGKLLPTWLGKGHAEWIQDTCLQSHTLITMLPPHIMCIVG